MSLLKELLKLEMIAITPVKVNTVSFKEWMTAILFVTKTVILLLYYKGKMAAKRVVK